MVLHGEIGHILIFDICTHCFSYPYIHRKKVGDCGSDTKKENVAHLSVCYKYHPGAAECGFFSPDREFVTLDYGTMKKRGDIGDDTDVGHDNVTPVGSVGTAGSVPLDVGLEFSRLVKVKHLYIGIA